MPRRTDRLKPMDHEIRQLEALKTLSPTATPSPWQPFSDALIDVAIFALKAARTLEAGKRPGRWRLIHLVKLVTRLPDLIPPAAPGETSTDDEPGE